MLHLYSSCWRDLCTDAKAPVPPNEELQSCFFRKLSTPQTTNKQCCGWLVIGRLKIVETTQTCILCTSLHLRLESVKRKSKVLFVTLDSKAITAGSVKRNLDQSHGLDHDHLGFFSIEFLGNRMKDAHFTHQ